MIDNCAFLTRFSSLIEITSSICGLFLYQIVAALSLLNAGPSGEALTGRLSGARALSGCAATWTPGGASISALRLIDSVFFKSADHFLHFPKVILSE